MLKAAVMGTGFIAEVHAEVLKKLGISIEWVVGRNLQTRKSKNKE